MFNSCRAKEPLQLSIFKRLELVQSLRSCSIIYFSFHYFWLSFDSSLCIDFLLLHIHRCRLHDFAQLEWNIECKFQKNVRNLNLNEKEGKLCKFIWRSFCRSFFVKIMARELVSLHFLYTKCCYNYNYMNFYYCHYLLLCALEGFLSGHSVIIWGGDWSGIIDEIEV